jgi:undecaprenyl diphosphate synthase
MSTPAGKAGIVPRHIAIIMDGNGRWAQERGLPRIEGHKAGAESVRCVVEACSDMGVEYLTLYAFSTENWKRPVSEIRQLMKLLATFLDDRLADLVKNRIRLNAIGDLDRLPAYVRSRLNKVIARTRNFEKGTLTLALSYGARAEIVSGVRAIAERVRAGELTPEAIDERVIDNHLYTAGLPDPDLIIRTANERRLSNFLLWQASYAEFWFTEVKWPDFRAEHLSAAIEDFGRRKRRFGGLNHA